jgi:transposase-like protein
MKKPSGQQIGAKWREADVAMGQGLTVPEVCKKLGVSEPTYYRWRQKYGGMSPAAIQELKALPKENARLKRLVADQALDKATLKEAAAYRGNGRRRRRGGRPSSTCVAGWGVRSVGSVGSWAWPARRGSTKPSPTPSVASWWRGGRRWRPFGRGWARIGSRCSCERTRGSTTNGSSVWGVWKAFRCRENGENGGIQE